MRTGKWHSGTGDVEWETPPALFAQACARIGVPDWDVCATKATSKCGPRYFGRDQREVKLRDGLEASWHGIRIAWMNPPYGRVIGDWVYKARCASQAGIRVIGLLPARTDTAWWHNGVEGWAAEVQFLRGRVHFLKNGKDVGPAGFPSCLVYW